MAGDKLKIVFVCSEAVPFAKTGGMADVLGSLPRAISRLGHDVSLIIPRYGTIDMDKFKLKKIPGNIEVSIGGKREKGTVYQSSAIKGVRTYLLDNPDYYNRAQLYGTPKGDYLDNDMRFAFFSRGALEIIRKLSLRPDVVHCHDWQTGLIPVYMRTHEELMNEFDSCRVFYTVHNLAYQGNFKFASLAKAGLSDSLFRPEDGLEFFGKVSYLKGGIVFSDVITTVSPSYADEIQRDGLGLGFEGILRTRSNTLHGIVNGIDYTEWNPATDELLPFRYNDKDFSQKELNRRALLKRCKLRYSSKRVVVGMISRLAEQKGLDILSEAIPELFDEDVYFVILGFGDQLFHDLLKKLSSRKKDRLSVTFAFDNDLAHLIYAGSDVFIMPSRYEPCGLGQLISMKYGTPPLVRSTGGLKDTVTPFDLSTGSGTGFVFEDHSKEALLTALRGAIDLFSNKQDWNKLMSNCMSQDFSWDASALQYLELYRNSARRATPGLVSEGMA